MRDLLVSVASPELIGICRPSSRASLLSSQTRMNRPGSVTNFSDVNGQAGRRCTLAHSRLRLIDHERRHLIEEFPKNLLGLFGQRSFPKSTIHQTHPSVAGSLIDRKRRMPRAEARMASFFNVSLRPPKPTNQEVSEALLS